MSEGTVIGHGVIPVSLDGEAVAIGLRRLSSLTTPALRKIGVSGGSALAAGIGAAALGAAGLVKVGEEFHQMETTIVRGTGASGKALEGLKEAALNIGRTTPASFADIGTAVAGVSARLHDTGKPLEDVSKGILNLTRITGTNLSTNIAAVTRLFEDWSIKSKDQSDALDKVVTVSQHTGISVSTLMDLMVKFGSPLRQLGLGFNFTAAMFGQFEQQGVNIQTAIPGLRQGLRNLAKDIDSAGEDSQKASIAALAYSEAVKKYGKDSPQAESAMFRLANAQEKARISGLAAGKTLPQALAAVIRAIKTAGSSADANSIAFKVFGTRAGPDLAAAIREGRFNLSGLLNDLKHSHGTLQKTADDSRTLGESWKIFTNNLKIAVEPVAVAFFGALNAGMRKLSDDMPRIIAAVKGFFAGVDLTGLARAAESALTGIATAIQTDVLPPLREMLPYLVPVAKFLIQMFGQSLIGLIKGVGQTLKGLVQIIGGVFKLVDDLIHGRWSKLWGDFRLIVSGALNLIAGLFRVWWNGSILAVFKHGFTYLTKDIWVAGWNGLKNLAKDGAQGLRVLIARLLIDIVGLFKDGVRDYLAPYKAGWATLRGLASDGWRFLKNLFGDSLGALVGVFRRDIATWRGLWSDFWSDLNRIGGKIGNLIKNTIPDAFRTGVGAIGRIWSGLRAAVRSPVAFIVNVVYDKGIVPVVNAIPGVPDLSPIRFAGGGAVRGGIPGKDSVSALLMPGEHVWTAEEVRKAGGQHVIAGLRDYIRRFGLKGFDPDPARFANGGAVSTLGLTRANMFARSQVGKPYVWGSAGPGGYDCSGFMSAITNVILGQYPYARRGTTATFPWAGFLPGWGQFTIGSVKDYGGSGIGHMAGTLMGMNVESAGGVGVRVGAAARGAGDPGFRVIGHLGSSTAPVSSGGGGSILPAWIGKVAGALKAFPGFVSHLTGMGTWGKIMAKMVATFPADLKKAAEGAITGAAGGLLGDVKTTAGELKKLVPHIFDQGGVLGPGMVGVNRSGRPELVLSPRQTAAVVRAMHQGDAGLGPQVTVNAPQNTDPEQVGDIVASRIVAALRMG